MRCPKCHYISFDSSDRCRNCGYEFSLTVDVAALDLPIQTGEEPVGPLADFALSELDIPAQGEGGLPDAESARRPVPAPELPLFTDRDPNDDAPLVNAAAVPRPPLAVRRSSPASPPRAPRSAADEPALNLEFADEEEALAEQLEERGDAAPDAGPRAADVVAHSVARLLPRLAAGLIDLSILAAIDAAVLYFTLKIVGFSVAEIALLPPIPLVAFLLLLNGGYFVAFVAAGGQTIGKMAAGIKVVPAASEPGWHDRVPLGTAFVRAAAYLVSIVPAGVGLVPVLFAPDRRAVHDRLAHTRVVKA